MQDERAALPPHTGAVNEQAKRPTLQAWRDPSKVVITKGRWHGGWWLVTLYARRTIELPSHAEALAYTRLVFEGIPGYS